LLIALVTYSICNSNFAILEDLENRKGLVGSEDGGWEAAELRR
jgi:hypothetical protein